MCILENILSHRCTLPEKPRASQEYTNGKVSFWKYANEVTPLIKTPIKTKLRYGSSFILHQSNVITRKKGYAMRDPNNQDHETQCLSISHIRLQMCRLCSIGARIKGQLCTILGMGEK